MRFPRLRTPASPFLSSCCMPVRPTGKQHELCNTYGLWYFLDQSEVMQFRELSASDPSVWSYQPEIEIVVFGTDDERANHVIVSGKPPTGGSAYALTEAEAYDDTNVALVLVE